MRKIVNLVFVMLTGVTILPLASAQTDIPPSPRDNQDRRDQDRDFSDAELAVVRDQCGNLTGDDKELCIHAAWEQRGRVSRTYRAPSYSAQVPGASAAPATPSQNTGMQPAQRR